LTAPSTARATSSKPNIVGTFNLLEAVGAYWAALPNAEVDCFVPRSDEKSVIASHSPVIASAAKQSTAAVTQSSFRFLHVSTYEVYGTLSKADPAFAETNAYEPNSPYSASKAASDHLVRAWHHTYGLSRLPTRLMVALLFLKHAFNEREEVVIQRWPCDPTQLGRFRKLLGEEGVEELLALPWRLPSPSSSLPRRN